jgi:TRAP-type C4-dicarboxylate transport system permease small subunit
MTRALNALWLLNALLARAAKFTVVMFTATMVASIVWQVFTRVFFNRSPPWTEEVALLMFTWIVLIMVAVGVREHLHVRVDALLKVLPIPFADMAERILSLLIAAIGGYLLWSGLDYLREMHGATSAAIRYPAELLYMSMPVASVLICLFAIENAIRGDLAKRGAAA